MFLLVTIVISLAALAWLNLAKSSLSSLRNPSVATSLFERANAIKGQNPNEASELRASAMAFLSVVR